MRFFFITNSPVLARFVSDNGADRIFVDLELIGKVERQGHLNTVISRHHIDDVRLVRAAVPDKELMVRLNPLHEGSQQEIDLTVESGADIIMLPMFRTTSEACQFADMIAGRCRLCLLVETRAAMQVIGELVSIPGVDEFHIGLNDLSLDLRLNFMFEPFPLGLVDAMATELTKAGKPFGIGGLARADEGLLPARLLIGEHVRLGSSAAILSRTFHRQHDNVEAIRAEMDFAAEVALLREIERDWQQASSDAIEKNRIEAWQRIADIRARRSLPNN
ncbi:hypothetical protein JW805_20905 [Roseomonas aeriglobus]|nr:hypothetical protein [Roseomonas aeriglobus]